MTATTRRTVAGVSAGAGFLAALVLVSTRLRTRARRVAGRLPGLRNRVAPQRTYTCECGQAYRVTGLDRHRVYWLEGAPESDPVLGSTCEKCDHALPAH